MKKGFRVIFLFFTIFQVFIVSGFSQNDTIRLGRSSGLQLSGFVRVDYFYDTRQTDEGAEGVFTFYPLNKLLDSEGRDLNANPKANLMAITSRLSTLFYAPDVFNAKSTAYIEFDFTGTSNTSGVRMRQAYANFAWTKANLLIGRAWHPMSVACAPFVVGPNKGAPFSVFNRSEQVRLDYTSGNLLLAAAALYQSNFASFGPAPGTLSTSVTSSTYLRDASLPECVVQVAYKSPTIQLGVLGSIKSLKPRLYTMSDYTNPNGQKYKTNEKITTYVVQTYAQYQRADWALKAQVAYTQNTTESLMLGGYAVSAIDPVSGHEKYTPTQYLNYWINVDYGKKWQAGCFAGYLNSLGTLENVTGAWFARAHNIKYMYRLSPHVFYNVNNWQFAAEFECTVAAFGEVQNSRKAKIVNESTVANYRTNLMISFIF